MNYKEAKKRATELVDQMTVEEMCSQLLYTAPAIERLQIHEYNWWNEALHGVARAGEATVFPQAIGVGATFDKALLRKEADAIATEGRAKYNESIKEKDYGWYRGLTYWSPNVNIFRDPRWGRGQETYGEDPCLTSYMGLAFVKGLQGNGEYYKSAACAKHFAVHSGPEEDRHKMNAEASKKDLFETYLPAFETLVTKGKVEAVMGAYNRTNGYPCCAHPYLIGEVLRKKWGFKGHFVSDCWALVDFYQGHKVCQTPEEAAGMAIKEGCDVNCGSVYSSLYDAYQKRMASKKKIRESAIRLFTARMRLGEFEKELPYSDISLEKLGCKEHQALNLKMSQESIVLLKNNGILPLDKKMGGRIAVVGPNGDSRMALVGNYYGEADEYITVSEGIRDEFRNSRVFVSRGASVMERPQWECKIESSVADGVSLSRNCDLTVLVIGYDESFEGEECPQGDRGILSLPQGQQLLVDRICDNAKKLIIIQMSGCSIDIGDKAREKADAILHAWYPGALGGKAIANILSGKVSPSGKLPITFYYADTVLPDIHDYSMKNRTYRYFDGKVLYPFGYGLSYTSFALSDARIQKTSSGAVVTVTVTNTGKCDGRDSILVTAKKKDSRFLTPNIELCAFESVFLKKGQSKKISIPVENYWLKSVDNDGERVFPRQTTLFVDDKLPTKDSISFQL